MGIIIDKFAKPLDKIGTASEELLEMSDNKHKRPVHIVLHAFEDILKLRIFTYLLSPGTQLHPPEMHLHTLRGGSGAVKIPVLSLEEAV